MYLDTLIIRKRQLENDEFYLRLAETLRSLRGVKYDLKDDALWTDVDWKIKERINEKYTEYDRRIRKNPRPDARFIVEDNLFDIWINSYEYKRRHNLLKSAMLTINKKFIIGFISILIAAAIGYALKLVIFNYLDYDIFSNLDNLKISLSYFCSLPRILYFYRILYL